MIGDKFFQATLIERTDFTEDLALFRFRVDSEFNFRSGQYATIAITDGAKIIQRPYSIVSSPYQDFLEFFIELVPHGTLTPRLWALKTGGRALIRKRMVGSFTLERAAGFKHHLMAATVTGVAPFVSIVRTHREELRRGVKSDDRFLIIHGGSRSWELGAYRAELAELEREGWLTYVPTVSRPLEDADWKGETGRVEDVLRKHADRSNFTSTNAVAYSCGHPQMIENARGILSRARFGHEQIKEETFFVLDD